MPDVVPEDIPPLRFADARGTRIAYQDFGAGPATVVAIPPMAQNIEMAWEWPAIRAMLERFATFSRYIVFDKRGTGVSDRRTRVNPIDASRSGRPTSPMKSVSPVSTPYGTGSSACSHTTIEIDSGV